MGISYSTEPVNPEEPNVHGDIENHVPFIITPPSTLTTDSIVNSVITQFVKRSNVGLAKYGTTLDRTDLSLLDWVQHAQEELMDGILYLEKIKNTLQK
jgi:hypothetical protein